MRRFYIENIEGNTAIIGGSEAHHIKDVLRQKPGDIVFLFDGAGSEYEAEISGFRPAAAGSEAVLKIISKVKRDTEPSVKIFLYQSLPRFKKFDFIVEKSTELGVFKIIPVISERTNFNLPSERGEVKLARWRKIAMSAAKQCGRAVVPEVADITKFEDAVGEVSKRRLQPGAITGEISIIPWESEQKTTLKEVLRRPSGISSVNLFIGPEGGFSGAEIELAISNKILPVSLGKRILRAETAPIAAISNILYELG